MNLLTTTVPTRSSAECQDAVWRGAGGGIDDAEGGRDDRLDTFWSGAQEPGLGVAGLAARRITGAASPVGDRAARHRLDRELLGIGERFDGGVRPLPRPAPDPRAPVERVRLSPRAHATDQLGKAHVCPPVTNTQIHYPLPLENAKIIPF